MLDCFNKQGLAQIKKNMFFCNSLEVYYIFENLVLELEIKRKIVVFIGYQLIGYKCFMFGDSLKVKVMRMLYVNFYYVKHSVQNGENVHKKIGQKYAKNITKKVVEIWYL